MKAKTAILVVDDQPQNIELLASYLVPKGYEIVKAANGEEALEKLSAHQIDLILLDVRMPGMDGFELTRRIRQDNTHRMLPIILVTVLRESEDRVKGIEAGCDDFISTPVDKMELLARVRSLLKVKAYNDLMSNYQKELESEVTRRTEELKHALENLQRDITERKRAEEQLRQSDELFRLIAENATDLIAVLDLEGKRIYSSPSYRSILGDPESLRGTDSFNEIHPEDREKIRRIFLETVRSGIGQRAEYRFLLEDGSVRHIESQGSVIRDENGNTNKVVVVSREVTERKRAEESQREREKEFRSLAEAMPQMVWITRADGWNIYFNQQWVEYTGLTLEESYGHGWNKPFHPDDQQRAWDAWQDATNHGATYSLECRIRRADGVYTWWLIRGVPVMDTHGAILKWFGTCTDINDLKLAEAALRESEELFKLFMRHSPVFTYIKAVTPTESRVVQASDNFVEMIGVTAKDMIGKSMKELFPQEFAAKISADDWNAISKGEVLQLDEELKGRHYNTIKFPIALGGKKFLGGYTIDVTERELAQLAIRQEKEFSQTALDSMPGLFYLFDDQGKFLRWNKNFEKVSGYTSGEVASLAPLDLFEEPDKTRVAEAIQRVFQHGEATAEAVLISKHKARTDIFFTGKRFQFDSRQCLVGMGIDITDRRRAEEKINHQLEELKRWQEVTLGREDRIRQLKLQVNELLVRLGETIRYPSQENVSSIEKTGNG
jgi:PAS domain S-box-containing protein